MAWACSVKELALQPRHQPQPKPGLLCRGFGGGVVPQHATAMLLFSPVFPPPNGCVYPGMGRKGSGVKAGKERDINNLLYSSLQMFKISKSPERSVA